MVSALIKEFDGGCSGSGRVYRVPLFYEILAQRIGHDWLIVYHKNSHLFVFHLLLLSGNRRTLRAHLLLLLQYVVVGGYLSGKRKLYYKSIVRQSCRPAVGLDYLRCQSEPNLFAADKRVKRIVVQLLQNGPFDCCLVSVSRRDRYRNRSLFLFLARQPVFDRRRRDPFECVREFQRIEVALNRI